MNASLLCSAVCLVLSASLTSAQNLNDASFQADADVDYQDFQLSPRPGLPAAAVPQRAAARPRSPAIANANSQPKVTPVPILKQINRHNEDGSYTYGFEGADGSFKIETKLATGEVIGKYGYVDDSGKVRTVEYGANKYGFQPAGEGITIPPVTIGNDTDSSGDPSAEDDGQSFVPVPVRPAKPSQASKRKPQRPVQQFAVDQRAPRPQLPPQQLPQQPYFVREPEDVQIRQPRPPTPSDINSLQLVLGNELRDAPQFQFRANEIPQRSFQPDENAEEPIPRPFPQSLTIPSAFQEQAQFPQAQFPQQPQFPQAPPVPVDFNQFDFGNQRAPAFRPPAARSQPKPKPRPQVLFLTQPEDAPQQAAVRRNSNVAPENRSILDELIKQYAIPNGAPAINDFSFSQNA